MPKRQAEHGVRFFEFAGAAAEGVGVDAGSRCDFFDLLVLMGKEFVQRRVKESDGDGAAGHDFKEFDEIGALHRQDFCEGFAPAFDGFGKDHLAHGDDAVLIEKHVLGAGKTDAFCAEFPSGACVFGRFRVGAHAECRPPNP